MNILWIEDNPGQIKYHLEALRRKGHDVKVVTNGEKALSIFETAKRERKPYDWVILDIMLPPGNGTRIKEDVRHEIMGVEVLRQMKELDTAISVVVLSAIADDRLLQEIRSEPCVKRWLKKPVSAGELMEAIEGLRITV